VAGVSTGTVVITGGSGGLGTAVVQRFLADGWRVVATVRGEPSDEDLEPGAGTVQADVTDEVAVAGAIAVAAAEPAAPLRAVVNLVGGFAAGGRVHETPVADFEAQFRLNLRPAYLVTAAAVPHLIAAGGGAVVCVSSRAALKPFAGAAGYIVSKAALLGLVDALAVEYRDDGIRVNAVLPSVIDTPATRAGQPNADFSRWVQPGQIADVIAFLCSDAAAVTSGGHIPVYGRA
jgi:NAD(P)-dependent dehydrogenase (short-subunit alcohol dehydrogenase family)